VPEPLLPLLRAARPIGALLRDWLPLQQPVGPSLKQYEATASLFRRLEPAAAPTERDALRVGVDALRCVLPHATAVALLTLPPAPSDALRGSPPPVNAASSPEESVTQLFHSPKLGEASRAALRDALRRVTCGDPATSVAHLCSEAATDCTGDAVAAPDAGWGVAYSRDWPDGAAAFSDWSAAARGASAAPGALAFLTLSVAPTGDGGRKAPLAAVLIRFDHAAHRNAALHATLRRGGRLRRWLAAAQQRVLLVLPHSGRPPPLSREVLASMRRVCGALGDALAARHAAAAAAALAHAHAIARDIYPEHLVGAMKARHSSANLAFSSPSPGVTARLSAAPLPGAAEHMLCESYEARARSRSAAQRCC
jgi:hypothetical protein